MLLQFIQAGTIGTVAGTGEPGCVGDKGPATEALLNEPKNISVDPAGNLYIADSENHIIRRVDARSGIITTIAGICTTIEPGLGVGEPPSEEAVGEEEDLLADPVSGPGDAYVQKSDLSGMVRYVGGAKVTDERFYGDGGPATKAALNFP